MWIAETVQSVLQKWKNMNSFFCLETRRVFVRSEDRSSARDSDSPTFLCTLQQPWISRQTCTSLYSGRVRSKAASICKWHNIESKLGYKFIITRIRYNSENLCSKWSFGTKSSASFCSIKTWIRYNGVWLSLVFQALISQAKITIMRHCNKL